MKEICQYAIYKHYKGGYYQVIGFCKDSETLNILVLYQNLVDTTQVWSREITDFAAQIVFKSGEVVDRFEHIKTKQDLLNHGWQIVKIEKI